MANGSHALISNTTGGQNTATGAFALENNATGSFNTANRSFGLAEKTTATPLRKRLRRIRKLRCVIAVLVPSTGERLPRARESEHPYNIN
ncbi:MAG: hypothetical protein DMF08_02440 [Verrucomicrobia bacterium]|jgi:hypothetical protein|nr:MAG: hypothetical protein DMF08_02440 [Verrucomicrobiota bacterium]PYL13186.1 MAG: hypothetical protein DMF48_00645 [Verrucomicrobiota bacterium]PYL48766.1 MAG: hypothetical protein DMF32_08605 [Verrucomicrobiota bacterium]